MIFIKVKSLVITYALVSTILTGYYMQETSHVLKECPSSPNCVSSVTTSESHFMSVIKYKGDMSDAKKKLLKVLHDENRMKITLDEDNYIRTEFKIAVFGFVDDVEFLFDDTQKVINFRSASRVGYSDLGVNKKRMIRIKRAFENLN